MQSEEGLLDQLERKILAIDEEAAVAAATAIIDSGIDPLAAIRVASRAITRVGDQFQSGAIFLPQLMLGGKTMKACMHILSKGLTRAMEGAAKGTVVLGATFGDMHDIGKNLVGSMMSVHGFEVVDLGVNVPPRRFLDVAESQNATFIAMSSLMTTSMPYQRDVIQLLNEAGARDRYYVVVGGGPVTPGFASDIGADGYGLSAVSAVKVCERLLASGLKPSLGELIIEE